jgi:murein DD-endopeptidase MepM/ murein hydrolase activator NlpD
MLPKILRVTSLIAIAATTIWNCTPKKEVSTEIVEQIETDTVEVQQTLFYGIPVDSFDIVEGKIGWNQTLSVLLEDFNIAPEKLYQLSNRATDVYDVRKLKAGSKFNLIVSRDSLPSAQQFIFEPDARSYVIYHLGDSVFAELFEKDVEIKERTLAGEVKDGSSLWLAITDSEGHESLVSAMEDILAWQVDFFRIDAGDRFKVIYEEEIVDGEVVGIKDVLGVYFSHKEKDYYAVKYNQGTESDYFDEKGNSLRKTFLKAPLKYSRISSSFSPRRYHPVLKRYKAHLGTDFAAPIGTPIKSVGDGVILEAQYGKYNGNYVKVRHNATYTTQYLHMSKIKSGIRPGVKVKQGDVIGYVGQTGLANGPHVCYRFWKNGRQVNPSSVDLPPIEPIMAKHSDNYTRMKNVMLHRLDNIQYPKVKVLMAQVGAQQ